MDTLRLLHFADLHLGVEAGGRLDPETGLNRRIIDVCDRLDEVCACVEEEGVHVVLFAGDAFKNQHPTPTLQRLFAQRIRRMANAGARVFLLVGNHDLPKMAALAHPFSIYDALEVGEVAVGDRARTYRLELGPQAPAPAVQVAALPHFSRHQVLAKLPDDVDDPDGLIERRVAETVRELAASVDDDAPAVFCGHCHVNQAELGRAQALFGISDVEVSLSTLASTDAFAYYALGHVHKRQVLSRDPFVAYPGSLERVDFGEGERVRVAGDGAVDVKAAEEKGFYRFDLARRNERWTLAGEPEFRPVAARRFVTIRVEVPGPDDPTDALISRVTGCDVDLADAFVKIVAEIDTVDRGRIRQREVRAVVPDAYDVRVVVESTAPETRVRDPRFATRMGTVEALENYLETREDWADERAELLEAGRALIREVEG